MCSVTQKNRGIGHLLRTPVFLTWKLMEAKLTPEFWASSFHEEPDWVWEGHTAVHVVFN